MKLKLKPEAIAVFKAWGKKGGQKRARNLSDKRRSEIAKRAARARWKR